VKLRQTSIERYLVTPVRGAASEGQSTVSIDRTSRFPIRRHANLRAMKIDEYDYWQQQPAHERLKATAEISDELYRLKDPARHAQGLQRTLVHLKR
jgi:hypothetical protein